MGTEKDTGTRNRHRDRKQTQERTPRLESVMAPVTVTETVTGTDTTQKSWDR